MLKLLDITTLSEGFPDIVESKLEKGSNIWYQWNYPYGLPMYNFRKP